MRTVDKMYFERQEEKPEVIFNCEWCSEDSTDEPKVAHFIESGESMQVCPDCLFMLRKQNVVE